MDDRARWARKEKDEEGFYTMDTFFSKIYLRWFPASSYACSLRGGPGGGVAVEDSYLYGESAGKGRGGGC